MKIIIYVIVLCQLLIVQAGIAQQNFFNVVSSEITPLKKIFFQQQINFYRNSFQSSSTFDFGLGKGYEVGVNILNVNSSYKMNIQEKDSFRNGNSMLFMLNGQKKVLLNQNIDISIGSQVGSNLNEKNKSIVNYNYFNFKLKNNSKSLTATIGCFNNNQGTYYSEIKPWFGLEYVLINQKLNFMSDWILSKSSQDVSVVGLVYFPTARYSFSFGLQIPNDSSKASNGFVFEFTLLPKK